MGCYRTNGQRDGAVDCVVYRDQCDASLHIIIWGGDGYPGQRDVALHGVVMGILVNLTYHYMVIVMKHYMGW